MALLVDPRNRIAELYNTEKGTNITWKDLIVESIGKNEIPGTSGNTMIVVSYKTLGPLTVFYNRYDIKDHLSYRTGLVIHLPANANGKVRDLLPTINKRLGLNLEPSEVKDTTYPMPASTGYTFDVIIDESPVFLKDSKVNLTVNIGYTMYEGMLCRDISFYDSAANVLNPEIFQRQNTSGGEYAGYGTPRLGPWTMTGNVDYTPIAHLLRNVAVVESYALDSRLLYGQDGIMGQLCSALRSVDGNPWVCYGNSMDYNLYGAMPVYNGPVAGAKAYALRTYSAIDGKEAIVANDLANPKFDNVLVMLSISGYFSNNMKANLMCFYYNN